MRAGRGNPLPEQLPEDEDALEWLRNRLAAWATLSAKGEVIHPAKSGIGVQAGINLEVWPRPDGSFLVGFFGYDNFSAVIRNLKEFGIPPSAGPFGIIGKGGSASVSGNFAYFRRKQRYGFFGYSDDSILRGWLGSFSNFNGTVLDVGFSLFKSDDYVGVSVGLPSATIGGGYSFSNTDYYRISDATKHIGEIASYLAQRLAQYRTHSSREESMKLRMVKRCEEVLTNLSARLNP